MYRGTRDAIRREGEFLKKLSLDPSKIFWIFGKAVSVKYGLFCGELV